MSLYVIKVVIFALTIVGITQITKRAGSFWDGILASLPLTSLTLFVALAVLLKRGVGFPLALGIGLLIMVGAYLLTAALVRRCGVPI